jgi:beta-aspartyl-peptidase (threonine type)
VDDLLRAQIGPLGGDGGVIAIDAQGTIVMDFSSARMFRAGRDSRGRYEVSI